MSWDGLSDYLKYKHVDYRSRVKYDPKSCCHEGDLSLRGVIKKMNDNYSWVLWDGEEELQKVYTLHLCKE